MSVPGTTIEAMTGTHPTAVGTGEVAASVDSPPATPDRPVPVDSALSDAAIVALVGREAFSRALGAVRAGHVSAVQTDDRSRTVTGRVRGTHRDDYAVTVFLHDSPEGTVVLQRSRCTCPVSLDCKHAAAVLVAARHQQPVAAQLQKPEWERVLGRLAETAPERSPRTAAALALEWGIERIPGSRDYPGRLDLRVRPLRRGKGGGWVRSGIGWDDLDFVARSCRAAHREVLLQLRAAAGPSARHALPRTPWLSLRGVSSVVWSLLDQAAAVGLELVVGPPLSALSRSADAATVSLDMGRFDEGGLVVAPRVVLGGRPGGLGDVGVLGEPAHGVFHLDPTGRLNLARLEALLPADVRALVLGARALRVPAVDETRFLRDFVPALRRHVALTSADPTLALPPPIPPRLTLAVAVRPEHRLRLDWSFGYQSAGRLDRHRLDEPAQDLGRDPAAEAALLAGLRLPADPPVLTRAVGPGRIEPVPHALLDASAALSFVQRVLPVLIDQGVQVLLDGDLDDFRESGAAPDVTIDTTARDGSADWFDLRVSVRVEGEPIPLDHLLVALTHDEEHLVLDSGVFVALRRPVFGALRRLIEEARALSDPDADGLRVSRYQVSWWRELLDLGVVGRQASGWRRTVRALGDVVVPVPVDPPASVQTQLRPYQRAGFSWLCSLHERGLGGILADDMGLGKTVQALALIAQTRQVDQTLRSDDGGPASTPPFLVVAPTSVVATWAAEARRFTPSLRVVRLGESQRRRAQPLADVVAGADLVLTSYALLRLDEAELTSLSWSGLILDEAQFVKNHRGRTYRAARAIAAPFTLAITGTPLENTLMDLWSLLSLTAPGLFPSPQQFSRYYVRPIERDRNQDRLEQLRRRIRPFVLRRTKDCVAPELPAKQEQVLHVELSSRHRRVYATHLQRERQKVLGLIDDLDQHRFSVLSSLTLLRRLSLDPALVDDGYAGIAAAKVELLIDHLRELSAEGHRGLVFSQFTSFLTRIRRRLDEAGIGYAYLDGSTTRRDAVVERFRQGLAPVFLISLKAGGFGLNLTEADYCFLLDPWWNPATEAQAVDRAHRIGQTRPVLVYRMVAKDTIEEKVMALKARKSVLAATVLDGGGGGGLGGGGLDGGGLDGAGLDGAGLSAAEIRELLAA